MLRRIQKSESAQRICINLLGKNAERRSWVESIAAKFDVKLYNIDIEDSFRRTMLRSGRKWATNCWRGGVRSAMWFDECGNPRNLYTLLQSEHAQAMIFVSPGAALVDPWMLDQQAEHYNKNKGQNTGSN